MWCFMKRPKPVDCLCNTLALGRVFMGASTQHGHDNHAGVIHIRVKIIFELKRPAATIKIRGVDTPVSLDEYLFFEKPVD